MSNVVIPYRFVVKRDTAANFTSANTLLLSGEIGLETDTRKFKIGDGSTAWNSLNYYCAVPLADPGADRLLFWDDSAGTWAHLTLGTNLSITGTTINASGGGGGNWTQIVKTTDETRTSNTTLTDDSTLLVALTSGTLYRLKLRAMYNAANATMDFKYGTAYTTTLTSIAYDLQVQGPGGNRGFATGSALIASSPITTTSGGVGLVSTDIIILPSADGTFSFKWAQNTSDAGNLTMLAGSYLEYMEIV